MHASGPLPCPTHPNLCSEGGRRSGVRVGGRKVRTLANVVKLKARVESSQRRSSTSLVTCTYASGTVQRWRYSDCDTVLKTNVEIDNEKTNFLPDGFFAWVKA